MACVHSHTEGFNLSIFTARKRSLRRLCFYRCLSVHTGGGHAWLLWGGGGMVAPGGEGGVVALGGHAWLLWGGEGHVWDTTRYGDMINERVLRILLQCILVTGNCHPRLFLCLEVPISLNPHSWPRLTVVTCK